MDLIYLNFFSVSALIPAFFNLFVSIFLFRIRKKSTSTTVLAVALLVNAVFQFAYFPAATYFHSSAAFHRWITVSTVLLMGALYARFFTHFPRNTHPRFALALTGTIVAITVVMSALFFKQTWSGERVYHFDGHYWDFAADGISTVTGLIIMIFLLMIAGLGIWRGITQPTVRIAALGMAAVWIANLAPGLTNVLSRDGALSREVHQTVANLIWISGNFTIFVVFVNTTRDRTTFMAKIMGISLATFLVVLTGISSLTLRRTETAYDQVHAREAMLALDANYRPADLRYIIAFDPAADSLRPVYQADTAGFRGEDWRNEFVNADVRRRIAAAESPEQLKSVLETAPESFAAYRAGLEAYALNPGKRTQDGKSAGQAVLDRMDGDRSKILYRTNKIKKIPDAKFRAGLKAFLEKNAQGAFGPLAGVLADRLEKSTLEGAPLKAAMLEYLRPVPAPGNRSYRPAPGDDENAEPAVAYHVYAGGLVYEVGFSYLAYRSYIHEASLDFIWILAAVLVVVLIGFRLFFRGSLLSPLDQLLQGLRKVNDGDLQVKVNVRVEDEIGYLTRSFNRMMASIRMARRKLQNYADNLEEKVRERTAELEESLDQVQSLKTQQDGDYFLTSLLISPLASNTVEGDEIEVDFLTKQKKQFSFRNWKAEIGGDICAAHRIELKQRPYTVFVNADAMGKSIQGAGGALVLGSVFESIVSRTRLSSQASDTYPERWLKNAFIELHKIFESFEGSMLVSIVVAIVDETTGLMYYINAEHPFTVLYRRGKARFLERDFMLHKLGFMGLERSFHITTFQLEPGDRIIAGSDGRDDIALGVNDAGERIMNEDETKFLMVVEEADGDLNRIQEFLQMEGELTDDLSLLQLHFRGNQRSAFSPDAGLNVLLEDARRARRDREPDTALEILSQAGATRNGHPRLLAERALAHYARKDYEAALAPLMGYIEKEPGHTSMIYRAALVNKVLRNYDLAADLGERVRLREPENVPNLVNLSNVYINTKNPRARSILDEALRLDPDNSSALKLKKHLAGT